MANFTPESLNKYREGLKKAPSTSKGEIVVSVGTCGVAAGAQRVDQRLSVDPRRGNVDIAGAVNHINVALIFIRTAGENYVQLPVCGEVRPPFAGRG